MSSPLFAEDATDAAYRAVDFLNDLATRARQRPGVRLRVWPGLSRGLRCRGTGLLRRTAGDRIGLLGFRSVRPYYQHFSGRAIVPELAEQLGAVGQGAHAPAIETALRIEHALGDLALRAAEAARPCRASVVEHAFVRAPVRPGQPALPAHAAVDEVTLGRAAIGILDPAGPP